MILIFGIPSESPVHLVSSACRENGLPFIVLNQRRQAEWRLHADYSDIKRSTFSDGEFNFDFQSISGIYLRTMDHTQVPEYENSGNKSEIDEMYFRLFKLLDLIDNIKVVNRPSPMLSNNSKPFQALIIRENGFDIPDTCITNDINEAGKFISKYNSVIYKSISGQRSIVKQLDDDTVKNLSRIRYCPVQFQEFVSGTNVRVHVIGNKTFATKVISDAVDYRYAHTEAKESRLEPFELDKNIADRCIKLSAALELAFSGIDLLFSDDGRIICFEVNPSPGYSYYESHTGQRISHALAHYLSG